MMIPQSFYQLSGSFWQCSHLEAATREQWIDRTISSLYREEQVEVKRFLMALFARGASNAELERVWAATSPDYPFKGEELRAFLSTIRDRIPH